MPRGQNSQAHTRIEVLLRKALAVAHFATAGSVTPQASWAQAAWFVDPQNVTGLASNQNTGKTALTPVRTWNGGVISKLATYAPRLRQSTTVTFLSGHTDNTDPVIFRPFIENGAHVTITAALPTGTAGVLGVVTAKNRATNTILSFATMPAGAAVGQLIVNTTQANSRALVEKSLGAGAFQISQPFAPALNPVIVPPVENNGWTTGDAVTLFTLTHVNLVDVQPTMIDLDQTTFVNPLVISQLTIWDPSPAGGTCNINMCVSIIECAATRVVFISGPVQEVLAFHHSAGFMSGLFGGPTTGENISAAFFVNPALVLNGGFTLFELGLSYARLDGDHIVGTNGALYGGALGLVAIDTGSTLSCNGLTDARNLSVYASNIIYGAGTINVTGTGRLAYASGAGAGVTTFRLTPRINLNSRTTGASTDRAAPSVITDGIALTAANLDAAAPGGFGGNVANAGVAFNLGGGSISNGAT